MKQPTFKEYLQSKDLLRIAADDPKQKAVYEVQKYCKLPVKSASPTKKYLQFKPKHKITVEWLTESIDSPSPSALIIECDNTGELETHDVVWPSKRLLKWLNNNT